jgi:hypothetical protein
MDWVKENTKKVWPKLAFTLENNSIVLLLTLLPEQQKCCVLVSTYLSATQVPGNEQREEQKAGKFTSCILQVIENTKSSLVIENS